jgi:hypothetical protein
MTSAGVGIGSPAWAGDPQTITNPTDKRLMMVFALAGIISANAKKRRFRKISLLMRHRHCRAMRRCRQNEF